MLMVIAGLVYIVITEKEGTPTVTVLELSTRSLTVTSTENSSLASNATVTSYSTDTVATETTSTVTDFSTINVTKTSTTLVPSGTSTVTSVVTSTVSDTVTQTVTSTVTSGSNGAAPGQFGALVVSCNPKDPTDSGDASCELILVDNGLPSQSAVGCTVQINGAGVPGVLTTTDGGSRTTIVVTNGAPVEAWCLGSGIGGSAGSQAVGTVAMGNSVSIPYSGTWQ